MLLTLRTSLDLKVVSIIKLHINKNITMIRNFTFLLVFLLVGEISAQTAKKYVHLEHFTNTRCVLCSSRNPTFFNTIENYEDLVHHVAVHPRVPYSGCVLYQANTADNEARRVFHGVVSTPNVYMDGTKVSQGSTLISASQLDDAKDKTTSVGIDISASVSNAEQIGTITVHTTGSVPTGNFRIFIAALEKTVNYNAPNGESVHHNVLRKFISSNEGDIFSLAASGGAIEIPYTLTYESTWEASEMFVMAWIQDTDSKIVLNSGSQFDPPVNTGASSTVEVNQLDFKVLPNPVVDQLNLQFDQPMTGVIKVQNLAGQEVVNKEIEKNSFSTSLNISDLQNGVYILRIESIEGIGVRKFFKE